eukprot:7261210-Pyramimonas_sp.AAC.1
MPSLSDTTTNWLCGKCVLIMRPMFCVWLRSSAASTWQGAAGGEFTQRAVHFHSSAREFALYVRECGHGGHLRASGSGG